MLIPASVKGEHNAAELQASMDSMCMILSMPCSESVMLAELAASWHYQMEHVLLQGTAAMMAAGRAVRAHLYVLCRADLCPLLVHLLKQLVKPVGELWACKTAAATAAACCACNLNSAAGR